MGLITGLLGGWQGYAASAAIGALAAGSLAWTIDDWRLGGELTAEKAAHAADLAAVKAAGDAAALKASEQQASWQKQAGADAQKNAKELSDAQSETAALRSKLAAGTGSMSIRVTRGACSSGVPAATSSASVGDGATVTVQLPQQTASDLAALAGDADACSAKLTELQDWATTILQRK